MVESLRRALFRMRTGEGEIDLSIKENGSVLSQQTEPSIFDGAGRLEELKASGKTPFPMFRATESHGAARAEEAEKRCQFSNSNSVLLRPQIWCWNQRLLLFIGCSLKPDN